jgi:hypothetical protein
MSDKRKKAAGAAKLAKDKIACNKPRKTPGHPTKSHVVKACENGKEKIIRFGQQGVKGSPKKEGESEAYRKRRESFQARHSKNIAKGKMSAAFWGKPRKMVTPQQLSQDFYYKDGKVLRKTTRSRWKAVTPFQVTDAN